MLFMPPRHGKSRISSVCWPAWHLGHHPDHGIILGSYGMDLSTRFSRKARGLVREGWYKTTFPQVKLSADANTAEAWETTQGGGVKAVGAGSAVTGHGGRGLVLDDTTKNRAEAYSALQRQRNWDWYCWDLESRLAPGGGILVLQTRWHHDDLPGRILERDGLKEEGGLWEVITYPAVAIEDEFDQDGAVLRRKGEALHPERYPVDCAIFNSARRAPSLWNALYQQRPTPEEGGLFKKAWWEHRRWTSASLPSRWDELIISVDATFKDTKAGSFVVLQVWGRRGGNAYLLHQEKGRWDFVTTLARLVGLRSRWPDVGAVLVEDKANGPAILSILRDRIPGLIAIEPDGSKEARASAVSPYVEAGNVFVPSDKEAHWVGEFIEECAAFPAGSTDDQVDGMSQALRYLFGGGSAWLDKLLYG